MLSLLGGADVLWGNEVGVPFKVRSPCSESIPKWLLLSISVDEQR